MRTHTPAAPGPSPSRVPPQPPPPPSRALQVARAGACARPLTCCCRRHCARCSRRRRRHRCPRQKTAPAAAPAGEPPAKVQHAGWWWQDNILLSSLTQPIVINQSISSVHVRGATRCNVQGYGGDTRTEVRVEQLPWRERTERVEGASCQTATLSYAGHLLQACPAAPASSSATLSRNTQFARCMHSPYGMYPTRMYTCMVHAS